MIPIYITSFNRLICLKSMCKQLEELPNSRIIIIDNASTYEPLMDWLKMCDYEVIFSGVNHGKLAPWKVVLQNNVIRKAHDYYVVSDPDMDFADCPNDVLEVLREGLDKHKKAHKAGVSLEINDLPEDGYKSKEVFKWESQWWKDRADKMFFNAFVDTTFALYRSSDNIDSVKGPKRGIRSDRPYIVRHTPWYTTPNTLTIEDKFYMKTLSNGHWSQQYKKIIENLSKPT